MRFKRGDKVELYNGTPIVVLGDYAAPDGQAYRVKTDASALSGADLATLKSTKPYKLSAWASHSCRPRSE